MNKLTQS